MTTYTVINGEGTIEMQADSREQAFAVASEMATEHDEPFFVSGPGIATDPDDDDDIGEQVDPEDAQCRAR